MKDRIELISGNSFSIQLEAETEDERMLLSLNYDQIEIARSYQQAIEATLGKDMRVASLTPAEGFPYCATIEVYSWKGSV